MLSVASVTALLLSFAGCGLQKSPEDRVAACKAYKRNAVCSTIGVDADLYLENGDPTVCMDSSPSGIADAASVGLKALVPECSQDGQSAVEITAKEVLEIVESGSCGTAYETFLQCRRQWTQ